ncbi:MAG TPA: response regulator [Ktedonobacterales bacterium]|nr:response regulator [Ktedonobacterales bacterium]
MAKRILVINDTPEILELFQEILAEEGYEVILYSYATQDTAEIERHRPDLIILDYIFGTEKLGWQLLQKLKMRPDTAGIPIIICTAAIREVREIEGYLLAKGVTLVPKPFDIDDLLLAVSNALVQPEVIATLIDKREDVEGEGERPMRIDQSASTHLSHNPPRNASEGKKTPSGERRARSKRQGAHNKQEPG